MIASILLQAGPNGAHGTGHGTGAFLWSPLLVLVALLVVGLLVYLAVGPSRSERTQTDETADILRKQYARGAIDDEEFERRRTRLEESQR